MFDDREKNIKRMAALASQELPLYRDVVYAPRELLGEYVFERGVKLHRISHHCRPSDPVVKFLHSINDGGMRTEYNFRGMEQEWG